MLFNKLIFKSIQSKIFSIFALISLLLTIIKYRSIVIFTSKLIAYYFIIRNIECNIYGNCELAAWINIIVPILSIIIVILDYFHIFKKFKENINTFVK